MSFTTTPVVGPLRASVNDDLITELRPLFARKTADETLSNSTTLQNDDELFVTPSVSQIYQVYAKLYYGAGTSADIKFGWTYPSGASLDIELFGQEGPTLALALASASGDSRTFVGAGVGSFRYVWISGLLVMGSTAGNFTIQWAQNAAIVENTVVKAGSRLWLKQMI